MKEKMKNPAAMRIPGFFMYGIAAVLLFLLLSASIGKQKMIYCEEVHVSINAEESERFVKESTVEKWVMAYLGNGKSRKTIKDISLSDLETYLTAKPYVSKAYAHFDIRGRLSVQIDQDLPLVRVIDGMGLSYYITETRKKMPLGIEYTARVPIVTGHIPVSQGDSIPTSGVLYELFKYGKYMQKDHFMEALTEQIYISDKGDMEIIPKAGDFSINIGDAGELDKKSKRILSFYKKGVLSSKYENVRSINVKYDHQIICTN